MKQLIRLMRFCLSLLFLLFANHAFSQQQQFHFRIRTITAGVTLKNLSDTTSLNEAIIFLKRAEKEFTNRGYEVQTLSAYFLGNSTVFTIWGK